MSSIAQKTFPLYPDTIPNSRQAPNAEFEEDDGSGVKILRKVSVPTLTMYAPRNKNVTGKAVIICPGGSYEALAIDYEGSSVAELLAREGITAFVLKYRLPDKTTMNDPSIGPLQDAQQAIRTVREKAAEWKIKSDSIGIMGFSAGGHLASSAATHFKDVYISNPNKTSVRPDFQVLVYPVISFSDIGHRTSRKNLIGENPSTEKIAYYSNELHIVSSTPPAFLVHADDDDGVLPENSILYYEALRKFKISAELHVYKTGGHGFGLEMPGRSIKWLDAVVDWLK